MASNNATGEPSFLPLLSVGKAKISAEFKYSLTLSTFPVIKFSLSSISFATIFFAVSFQLIFVSNLLIFFA